MNPRRGGRLRRRPVRRRQHRYRRRTQACPGNARRQQAADLRAVSHRRLAHRRRDGRVGHCETHRGKQRRAGPRVRVRRRLRRQQPPARQAGPRQLRLEPIRPAERGHRSIGQRALSQDRRAGDDRCQSHGRHGRQRRRRRPSTASTPRASSTCSRAIRSCSSAATEKTATPR